MELDILTYQELLNANDQTIRQKIEQALLCKGIIGIKDVPHFLEITRAYIEAARAFSALENNIKQKYAPDRDAGITEGYELGAEWFQNQEGIWQIDDKKSSYYAYVPDHAYNKWPSEVDLRTPYLALGESIFNTGKLVLNYIGINDQSGFKHEWLKGYGRMLHYHKEGDATNANPDWCGAHFDHGVFSGLVPAYYFQNQKEVEEPSEAGLYITPTGGDHFEKIHATDKSVLLFQVGEFGQLLSDDRIKATKHIVKKAKNGIERFTFALFYSVADHVEIQSKSLLKQDARYADHMTREGKISYGEWQKASYARYRVVK